MKVQVRKPAPARSAKRSLKPALALEAETLYVKAGGVIPVAVELKNLDAVELTLEPAKIFSLDLPSLTRKGLVRLRGKKDGKATLIASGRVGAAEVIRKMLHVECEGPVVRILGFGYIPRK